jgi:hypothetical protein
MLGLRLNGERRALSMTFTEDRANFAAQLSDAAMSTASIRV